MMPFMVTDKIARGETITLFNAGQMKRDWTFVDDIATGVEAALRTPLGYEVINLGRGEPVLMADFVKLLEDRIGKKRLSFGLALVCILAMSPARAKPRAKDIHHRPAPGAVKGVLRRQLFWA